MARLAWSWIAMVSTACGPTVVVPDEGDSDDAGTSTPSQPSTGDEPDTTASSEGGMLPPCEPWTLEVVLDDPTKEPITDIDFRGEDWVIGGMLMSSTLALLDGGREIGLQHDLGAGYVVWDVFTDGTENGPFGVVGTAPDPTGEHEGVFFYAYIDNTGDLVHLVHYQDAVTSEWEPMRLFRASGAGFVISGHRGTTGEQSLSTIRIDYDGSVLWSHDVAISPDTPFGNGYPKGGADLLAQGDLVQLTGHGARPRVVRTTMLGDVVWDQTLDIDARVMDVRAHPSGDILVLARSDASAHLVRVDGDANVLWERTYSAGSDSFPSVVGVTALGNAVVVAGGTREGSEEYGTWIFVVDEAGELLFEYTGEPGSPTDFYRAVYGTSFLVTAQDHAWVARVTAHPC